MEGSNMKSKEMDKPENILESNYVGGKEVFTKYSKKLPKKKKDILKAQNSL